MMISPIDQRRLLVLARRCLEARVLREAPPSAERGGALDALWSAFVTIHAGGALRGCLGRLDPKAALADTIAHLAAMVADSDPRFEPVMQHELEDLCLEISVLTPEREIVDVTEIEIGRHGIIVVQGSRRGLLLPQVAVEHSWDRTMFLDQTCVKAGLAPDAWKRSARVLCFEAQVFSEQEFQPA